MMRPNNRRRFLQNVGGGMLAASVAPAVANAHDLAGNVDSSGIRLVAGIDPKNLVDEYRARGLDALSDAELYRQSAAIISSPPRKGQTSFTLHAPLELMARYGLLPFVEPQDRHLARLQMVASAAAYDSGVDASDPPKQVAPFANLADAKQEFTRTFQSADGEGLEALTLQIGRQFGTSSLVQFLTPLALPTLTGASHSHIGLWLLLRHGTTAEVGDAALLRAAARQLAREPGLRLSSFSGMAVAGGTPLDKPAVEIEKEIFAKLVDPTNRGPSAASRLGMRNLITAGEKTGNADALFGDLVRHDLTNEQMDAAFRAVLRVCAHSMLQDDLSQAKFGWSHCLTLPQAACGLSSLNIDRKLALAATFVWISAYRSVASTRAIDFTWAPEKNGESLSVREALYTSPTVAAARVWHADPAELPAIRRALATEASIRNDQHLAKYTRACFDMGSFDPLHVQLYLAAAAHLCAHWIGERPREKITDNLLVRRNTPR